MARQPDEAKPVVAGQVRGKTDGRVTPSMVAAARAQVVIADRLGKQVSAKVRKVAALAR